MPIIDSTRTVLPLEEAFTSDTLHLSEKAARVLSEPALSWSDYPANYILLTVFTFIAIISLRRMLNILPRLLNSRKMRRRSKRTMKMRAVTASPW